MKELAIEHAPNEVGTSLVGSYSDDGTRAVVRDLAPVSNDSRGSRFSFMRGVQGLAEFFASVFRRSNGLQHYVGEWHSHPGGNPVPSPIDDANQSAIARDIRTECPEAILVIIGGEADAFDDLGVFIYSRTSGRVELEFVTSE